jgi:mannose/cellobiose epimerase-like protein (N-acyl-D-glucosamine 2-epimerase family)
MTDELVRPTHRLWLAQHTLGLLAFGRRSPHPDGGARWLDDGGWYLIDHDHGSWHHQLAPDNAPNDSVWSGKPDIYHVFQATLGPRLPLYPMLATAVAEGHLDEAAGTAD